MIITVPNRPPKFNNDPTTFATVTVPLNSIYDLPIPAFSDPDLTTPFIKLYEAAIYKVTAKFTNTNTNL